MLLEIYGTFFKGLVRYLFFLSVVLACQYSKGEKADSEILLIPRDSNAAEPALPPWDKHMKTGIKEARVSKNLHYGCYTDHRYFLYIFDWRPVFLQLIGNT